MGFESAAWCLHRWGANLEAAYSTPQKRIGQAFIAAAGHIQCTQSAPSQVTATGAQVPWTKVSEIMEKNRSTGQQALSVEEASKLQDQSQSIVWHWPL